MSAIALVACMPSWNTKAVLGGPTLQEPIITDSTQTGSICGIVIDSATEEPVVRSAILVFGTQFGAMSGMDGTFCINDRFVGEYGLVIMCIGYFNKRISDVQVEQDDSTRLTIHLVKDPAADLQNLL
jgi:hypothetical protein